MKLVKSLLLGSTALVAAAGAQAADLPVRQAAVVENICANLGSGFGGAFVLPGTETCLAISGFVRGEYAITERPDDAEFLDLTSFRARGRLNFDVRTNTDIGILRGYIRMDGRSPANQAFAAVGSTTVGGSLPTQFGGGSGLNRVGTDFFLDQGFVEIQSAAGQFIAGRATNNFQPGFGGDRFIGIRLRDGDNNDQFAYTFTLGGGFSATAAVEAPVRVNSFAFLPGVATGTAAAIAGNTFGFNPATGAALPGGAFVTGLAYGGEEAPDFIGRLEHRGSYGYVRFAGVAHQVSDVGFAPVAGVAGTTTVSTTQFVGGVPVTTVTAAVPGVVGRNAADDEIGFAVEASGQFNLPFFNTGSLVYAYGTYADGAIGYLGFGSSLGAGNVGGTGFGTGGGNFTGTGALRGVPIADAVVVNGSIETTEGWQVGGGAMAVLLPTIRANIFGSYTEVEFAREAQRTVVGGAFAGAAAGFVDFSESIIGGNIIWSPVRNLDIGVEVLYQNVQFDRNVVVTNVNNAGVVRARLSDEEDALYGRFRVNRSF